MNDTAKNDERQPARDLGQALSAMSYEVVAERFALVGFESEPAAQDLACLLHGPAQLIREGGESTLLLPKSQLAECLQRHPGARVEPDLVWIRFRAAMGWEVVGFLARVTGALAEAGIPLGAVCGFSRDHLFLHERYLDSALAVLERLFPNSDASNKSTH